MANNLTFPKIITATAEELFSLRAVPLLWENELNLRPDVAEALEKIAGMPAGCVHWRSDNDHLYALELTGYGYEHPSMATVYGLWGHDEPRPPENETQDDLLNFVLRVSCIIENIDPSNVKEMVQFARQQKNLRRN